jgi:hypothetical protein
MTATYGDKTQEGIRMSVNNLAHLLNWESDQAGNKVKLDRMTALLFGSYTDLNLQEVNTVAEEILRLHTVFCRLQKISQKESRLHRIKLHERLSQQFLKIAHYLLDKGDNTGARRLQQTAYNLNWRIRFTRSYGWLFLKSLIKY